VGRRASLLARADEEGDNEDVRIKVAPFNVKLQEYQLNIAEVYAKRRKEVKIYFIILLLSFARSKSFKIFKNVRYNFRYSVKYLKIKLNTIGRIKL